MKLYNSLSNTLETFDPIDKNNVKMYVCGPTVYDRAHIGNARPAVVFDVLYRILQFKYGINNVSYARNFTDIDDKIINKANNIDLPIDLAISNITKETISWYHSDMDELNVLRPVYEPRATEYIKEMIGMIQILIDKKHAYVSNNHVLFDVKSFPNHGILSNRKVDNQLVGEKNEKTFYKKSPEDFVLWKPSDENQPKWQSPWGQGRPGWHIECSAMIKALLGDHIDIHGGGIDLLFPHHENEISQSVASCDHDHGSLANYWVHNNFVTVNNEKMSKSLGNFITVNELISKGITGQVIRFVFLKTHYRQILKWNNDSILEAQTVLKKWNDLVENIEPEDLTSDMIYPLMDDINTPLLILKMHEYANNGEYSKLKTLMNFIGLDYNLKVVNKDKVESILELRKVSKQNKRYALADDIRQALVENGIEVRDLTTHTEWKQRNYVSDSRLDTMYNFYKSFLYREE